MLKTQGRLGELAVEVHSDVPERFHAGMKLWGLRDDGTRREVEIEELWPHKGHLVVKLRGIDSISEAEHLVGCELQLPRNERAQLGADWAFVSDLIGCAVSDGGREIGRVADVRLGAGEAPLLIVGSAARKYEIPYARAYLQEIDLEGKRIRMSLPEGMLELDAPLTEEEKQQQRQMKR